MACEIYGLERHDLLDYSIDLRSKFGTLAELSPSDMPIGSLPPGRSS